MDERTAAMLAAYCRIDPEDSVAMDELTAFHGAASAYLLPLVGALPEEGSPRRSIYDTVLKALVLDLYDHRGAALDAAATENPVCRLLLNQLKHTSDAVGI